MNASNRTQSMTYQLIRSGQLNPTEIAVMAYICSFSQYCCADRVEWIGKAIKRSEKTVRRTINSLVQKGFITKKYTVFKRLYLQAVDHVTQKSLLGGNMVKHVLRKVLKPKKFHHDRSSMSGVNRSSMSESTKRETILEKNTLDLSKVFESKPKNAALERAKYLDWLKSQNISLTNQPV